MNQSQINRMIEEKEKPKSSFMPLLGAGVSIGAGYGVYDASNRIGKAVVKHGDKRFDSKIKRKYKAYYDIKNAKDKDYSSKINSRLQEGFGGGKTDMKSRLKDTAKRHKYKPGTSYEKMLKAESVKGGQKLQTIINKRKHFKGKVKRVVTGAGAAGGIGAAMMTGKYILNAYNNSKAKRQTTPVPKEILLRGRGGY